MVVSFSHKGRPVECIEYSMYRAARPLRSKGVTVGN